MGSLRALFHELKIFAVGYFAAVNSKRGYAREVLVKFIVPAEAVLVRPAERRQTSRNLHHAAGKSVFRGR